MRSIYRALRAIGDARAVARGPGAVVRRQVRCKAHRALNRAMNPRRKR